MTSLRLSMNPLEMVTQAHLAREEAAADFTRESINVRPVHLGHVVIQGLAFREANAAV